VRSNVDVFQVLTDEERDRITECEQPRWTSPMLATLTDERFDDPDWIYERKLDGIRILVFLEDGNPRLMTRNRKERNDTWPELVDALRSMNPPNAIVDGEIVVFDGNVTSFSRLQNRSRVKDEDEARGRAESVPAYLYLFDVLHLSGHDVGDVPLRSRKKLLKRAFDFDDPIRFLPHRNADGVAFWREACDRGWEGVIAKDATSAYVHDRSTSWLKFKCVDRQEFVVGGFTEPEGERVGFGAMLLGYHEDGDLVYAGRVGTGWDDDELGDLRDRMDGLERDTSPFDRDGPDDEEGVHWISPRLVAEIGFTEWTHEGRLRHPRYLGLREDKDPDEVVRERPRDTD